ncbi:TRAPP complex subunit Trs33 [Schizosaccharomyces pombe]
MIVHQQLPMSVNVASLDFLLIELVHTAKRLAEDRKKKSSSEKSIESDFQMLESIGFQVGRKITERLLLNRNRITETTDVMRFLCRELWPIVFRKPLDNLKTNRRGIFVLTDTYFYWFTKMTAMTGTEMAQITTPYFYFPSGFIRGVVYTFGYSAQVIAQCPNLPTCIFHVKFSPNPTQTSPGKPSTSESSQTDTSTRPANSQTPTTTRASSYTTLVSTSNQVSNEAEASAVESSANQAQNTEDATENEDRLPS